MRFTVCRPTQDCHNSVVGSSDSSRRGGWFGVDHMRMAIHKLIHHRNFHHSVTTAYVTLIHVCVLLFCWSIEQYISESTFSDNSLSDPSRFGTLKVWGLVVDDTVDLSCRSLSSGEEILDPWMSAPRALCVEVGMYVSPLVVLRMGTNSTTSTFGYCLYRSDDTSCLQLHTEVKQQLCAQVER